MIKRFCNIALEAGIWVQAFELQEDARVQLFAVNHSSSSASISVALIVPSVEVQDTDLLLSNAVIEANSYRVFKDLELPKGFALAVATENNGLTLNAVGVSIP